MYLGATRYAFIRNFIDRGARKHIGGEFPFFIGGLRNRRYEYRDVKILPEALANFGISGAFPRWVLSF